MFFPYSLLKTFFFSNIMTYFESLNNRIYFLDVGTFTHYKNKIFHMYKLSSSKSAEPSDF